MLSALAAFSLNDQALLVVLALTGLFFVVKLVDAATATWHRLRRTPPAEEVFATKPELNEVRQQVHKMEGRIEARIQRGFHEQGDRIERLERTMSTFTEEMSRSLGRIEGKLENT